MKNEVFGEANIVRCDLLDAMPSALDYVVKDMTRKLADRIMCEMENGELICSLQNVEQHQIPSLNSVEISRKVKFERLVRCKDCKAYDNTYCADGFGWCSSQGRGVTEEHFCADGEVKNDE